MQTRASAITKGPQDIKGVRTKRAFQEDVKQEETRDTSSASWYCLVDRDLVISGSGKPALKKWKWTKVGDKLQAHRLKSHARRLNVQMMLTQDPPKDVR